MVRVFDLPKQYYATEGLSSYSIAYTGALAASIGGLINLIPAIKDKSTKCVLVDLGLIVGGMCAATIFLKKANIIKGY